jgi:hypothetical protein
VEVAIVAAPAMTIVGAVVGFTSVIGSWVAQGSAKVRPFSLDFSTLFLNLCPGLSFPLSLSLSLFLSLSRQESGHVT